MCAQTYPLHEVKHIHAIKEKEGIQGKYMNVNLIV